MNSRGVLEFRSCDDGSIARAMVAKKRKLKEVVSRMDPKLREPWLEAKTTGRSEGKDGTNDEGRERSC